MSKRVYLSKNPYQTTQEEHTPVSIRIQASNATVKALHTQLQDAYRRDDVRLVRRAEGIDEPSHIEFADHPQHQRQVGHGSDLLNGNRHKAPFLQVFREGVS